MGFPGNWPTSNHQIIFMTHDSRRLSILSTEEIDEI